MPVPTRSRASISLRTLRRSLTTVAAALGASALALALALLPAAGANAHDYLISSSPAANSTQTAPLTKVTLTFDDVVLDLAHNGSSALLQVTGPDGAKRHFETGCPTIAGRQVSTAVALGAAGTYTVTWQIVSADGHTVSDSIAFTYQPPAGTTAAAGTTNRPACGHATSGSSQATGAASSDASGRTTSASDSGSLDIVITIAVIIVGLAVIGVVIVLVTARRRPPRAPEDD